MTANSGMDRNQEEEEEKKRGWEVGEGASSRGGATSAQNRENKQNRHMKFDFFFLSKTLTVQ